MVSTATIISIIVNIAICFGIPIGGTIYLVLAKKRVMKAVLVGAGVFILFQMVTRIPILTTVLPPDGMVPADDKESVDLWNIPGADCRAV